MPTDVHSIANTELANRTGDIVFVHGLNGNWRESWSAPGPDGFWPQWLGERFPSVGVWSAEYDASPSAWRGHAMPIIDRATNLADALLNREIGDRPLVFVTHSMGGLIVKQLLRLAYDHQASNPGYRRLIRSVRGIVFLATPHTGSDLERIARFLSAITRTTTAVTDMASNAPPLRDLNLWYRSVSHELNVRSAVYFETQQTYHVRVVDETSADPGILGVVPVGIDADHIVICKPASRDAQVYLSVVRFLRELFDPPGPNVAGGGAHLPP